MKNFYQLLVIITLGIFMFACSNNTLNRSNDTEETQVIEGSENEKYDFREATWGMSRAEVMQTEEGAPVFNSEYKIDYETEMLGFDSKISYTFSDDELIRASFQLLTKPKTNNEYIEIYENIQKELRKKYGKTFIDTIQHRDPSLTVDPEVNGNAVCNGELLYATQWDTQSSDIQLLLRGEDSECFLTIMYLSEAGFRQMLQDKNNKQ